MLGAMCRLCGFDRGVMTQAVEACVPQKFLELNLKAFAFGYERV
jgi:Pyruvate/2-oxoacid:ferredoxin oxidoreductase gamma subunit